MPGRLHIHWFGRTEPDAPTIVLLHGITNSGAGWGDAVRRWSSTYRIAAIDALGHGESGRFTDDELSGEGEQAGAGAVEALVTTTIAALEEIGAGSSPVLLLGHSMGGATATVVAVRRPELLRALIVEDPAWKLESLARQASRGAAWVEFSAEARRDPAGMIAEKLSDSASTWPHDEIEPWVRAKGQADPRFLAIGRPEMKEPWQQSVAALTVPTLLVTGDGEVIVGLAIRAELGAIDNRLVEVVVIEGAGHSVRRDRADAFHAVVDPWIAARFSG
ncbi:MAG: alpha/beta hydrolase [Pseudolysinimonas sp.]